MTNFIKGVCFIMYLKDKSSRICIRVDAEMYDYIKNVASKNGLTDSDCIRCIIRQHALYMEQKRKEKNA